MMSLMIEIVSRIRSLRAYRTYTFHNYVFHFCSLNTSSRVKTCKFSNYLEAFPLSSKIGWFYSNHIKRESILLFFLNQCVIQNSSTCNVSRPLMLHSVVEVLLKFKDIIKKRLWNKLFSNGRRKKDGKASNSKSSNNCADHSRNNSGRNEGSFPLTKLKGKLLISFKCKICGTRNTKTMSKVSYEKGVVIITCEGCKRRHLISDNLNWFPEKGKGKNVEEFLEEKGEKVHRVQLYVWLQQKDKNNSEK